MNLKEKFNAEHADAIKQMQLAKKAIAKKWLVIKIITTIAAMVIAGILLATVGKQANILTSILKITSAGAITLFITMIVSMFQREPKEVIDLNQKAKSFIKTELIPLLVRSLKKEFELALGFEEGLIRRLDNQEYWIETDGTLITYQDFTYNSGLYMQKWNVKYWLKIWELKDDETNTFRILRLPVDSEIDEIIND